MVSEYAALLARSPPPICRRRVSGERPVLEVHIACCAGMGKASQVIEKSAMCKAQRSRLPVVPFLPAAPDTGLGVGRSRGFRSALHGVPGLSFRLIPRLLAAMLGIVLAAAAAALFMRAG